MKKKLLLFITILIAGCAVILFSSQSSSSENEWISLFDGETTEGWRGYNSNEMPPGWTAKDGMLMFDTELELEQNYKGGKDIIYGNEEFDNFEFYVEWKIPIGGNSGIFYHIAECVFISI